MKVQAKLCVISHLLGAGHAFLSTMRQSNRHFISTTQISMVSELENLSLKTQNNGTNEATKVCVITGASQGLGQAMAFELVSFFCCMKHP